jgi:hypothetical protein
MRMIPFATKTLEHQRPVTVPDEKRSYPTVRTKIWPNVPQPRLNHSFMLEEYLSVPASTISKTRAQICKNRGGRLASHLGFFILLSAVPLLAER